MLHPPALSLPYGQEQEEQSVQHRGQLPAVSECVDPFGSREVLLSPLQADGQVYFLDMREAEGIRHDCLGNTGLELDEDTEWELW